jgi:hypothetical protein
LKAKHLNFETVLSVLDAMGFQLRVTVRRNCRARLARPKAVPRGSAERHELVRGQPGTAEKRLPDLGGVF